MFTVAIKNNQYVVNNSKNEAVDKDGVASAWSHATFNSQDAAQQLADKLNGGRSTKRTIATSIDNRTDAEKYSQYNSAASALIRGNAARSNGTIKKWNGLG